LEEEIDNEHELVDKIKEGILEEFPGYTIIINPDIDASY